VVFSIHAKFYADIIIFGDFEGGGQNIPLLIGLSISEIMRGNSVKRGGGRRFARGELTRMAGGGRQRRGRRQYPPLCNCVKVDFLLQVNPKVLFLSLLVKIGQHIYTAKQL